jgi:hypothetical protein
MHQHQHNVRELSCSFQHHTLIRRILCPVHSMCYVAHAVNGHSIPTLLVYTPAGLGCGRNCAGSCCSTDQSSLDICLGDRVLQISADGKGRKDSKQETGRHTHGTQPEEAAQEHKATGTEKINNHTWHRSKKGPQRHPAQTPNGHQRQRHKATRQARQRQGRHAQERHGGALGTDCTCIVLHLFF